MNKLLVKKIIKISVLSLLMAGTVIASELEQRTDDGRLKGWSHNPGFTPSEEPDKTPLAVEVRGPFKYDPRRKMYFYPKVRSDSNDSKESDGSKQ
ncbi:MAG: hypothetical protein K2W94_03605 [Alphaproteobacteria bacterium]|nr:hypothetical protein [Alphaproteobacteria bacterium]